jgi:copper chaperone
LLPRSAFEEGLPFARKRDYVCHQTGAENEEIMKTETLTIEGMSCGHCVKAVKEAIETTGAKTEKVEVGSAQLQYDETKISRDKIILAIEEEGYKVIGA